MLRLALVFSLLPAVALAQPDRLPQAFAGADSLGQWVEIGLGQTARYGDTLAVTFLEVEDSRCPEGATCVWQGEVVARVRVVARGAASEVALGISPWVARPRVPYTTPSGWALEAGSLSPVPPRRLTGADPVQRPYRLRLRWSR